jgi:primosomal protein N' (replication factor Y)
MQFATSLNFVEQETLFVEVILPLSLSINYTYRVPFELNDQVSIGKRVVVQFGKHRIYTALIKRIGHEPPAIYEAKYIIDVIDDRPIITSKQLEFWDWITSYYLCNEGDVMAAALPTGLKLASETILVLKDEFPLDLALTAKEEVVVSVLHKQQRITVDEVINLLGQKTVYPIINSLLGKGIIYIAEEVIEKYRPLLKSFITLNPFYNEEGNLKELFSLLEKAPRQLDALIAYLSLIKVNPIVPKQALLEASGSGQAAIKIAY